MQIHLTTAKDELQRTKEALAASEASLDATKAEVAAYVCTNYRNASLRPRVANPTTFGVQMQG